MKCLSDFETERLLLNLGVRTKDKEYAGFVEIGEQGAKIASAGVQLSVPAEAPRQAAMLDALWPRQMATVECLIWIRDWALWGSEDYAEVWLALRERHGEKRSVLDAPGHLFAEGEELLARGMSRLALAFGWDVYLVPLPIERVIYMTHDAYMEVYTPDQESLAALSLELETLGIRRWGSL